MAGGPILKHEKVTILNDNMAWTLCQCHSFEKWVCVLTVTKGIRGKHAENYLVPTFASEGLQTHTYNTIPEYSP